MLGGGDEKLVPIDSLRELERERKRCSMIESLMLGGGDEKLAPIEIWERVAGLVNRNMFTHNS
jgi:hypothetical protein